MPSESKYVVYMHTNRVNGKRYVGITKQKPEHRWRLDGSGYFRSPYFWNAIQKYGWECFDHEILDRDLSREDACVLEKYYIDFYKTHDKKYGYNMTDGGDGSLGWKPTDETIRKRSQKLKGRKLSAQHIERIRKANTGKKASDETRQKQRESHLGKKPPEHVLLIAKVNLEEAHEKQKKKVYCIDHEGRRTDFDSIKSAAAFYNEPSLNKNFKIIVETGRIVNGRQWFYKEVA